jgi:hypothetical protein
VKLAEEDLDGSLANATGGNFSTVATLSRGRGHFLLHGHGLQIDGENYLVPVNVDVVFPGDVAEECVLLSRITGRVIATEAGTNVIISGSWARDPWAFCPQERTRNSTR